MEFIKNNKNIFFLLGVATVVIGFFVFNSSGSTESGDEDVAQALAELVEEAKEQTPEEIVVEASKVETLADKANEAAIVNQVNQAAKNSVDADLSSGE